MPSIRRLALLAPIALLAPLISAASNEHTQTPLNADEKDWATRHMQMEHHVNNFDARSFFTLHDYDGDGMWEDHEIVRTYGLENDDSYIDGEGKKKKVDGEEKERVADKVLDLFDLDGDGYIELDEWMESYKGGKRLPDFGYGVGHHGDDEQEYEEHHFKKYHNANSPDSEFTHDEDIRHFARHDTRHQEAESQASLDKMPIVEANIPAKFRRA